MGKYLRPDCKMSRRVGNDIELKSKIGKHISEKCKMNTFPGEHSTKKKKNNSNYSTQLNEKQKLKYTYGIFERYLKNIYKKSFKNKNSKNLLITQHLEMRLDNVVYKIGLALTRCEARQLVSHKLICVVRNKKSNIVNIPSFKTKINDVIKISKKALKQNRIKYSLKVAEKFGFPSWLDIDIKNMSAEIKSIPSKNDLPKNINEQLVIEYYSR